MKTNHTLFRTAVFLIIGLVLVQGATLFMFSAYQNRFRYRVTREHLLYGLFRATNLAKVMAPDQVEKNLRLLHARGLRMNVTDSLPLRSIILPLTTYKILSLIAEKQHYKLRVSLALKNGRWLNFQGYVSPTHPWFVVGLVLSGLLLLLALVWLCLFALRQTALPAKQLSRATKRFSIDADAPPLLEQGSVETRQVIREFNQLQACIRKLLHDRMQMLAAISHDLRTPITRLQLRMEFLKDHEQYQKAVRDLDDMEYMINSILEFAKQSAHTEPKERFDINAMLTSLCDDLADAGKAVTFSDSSQRLPFYGRAQALMRACSNLIENAVKYGERADVSLMVVDNHLRIEVSDQGPGIPESEQQKVFEPFYRIDRARSPERAGTGLGMAVAREVILAHGGKIQLINRESGGLTVRVDLPLSA